MLRRTAVAVGRLANAGIPSSTAHSRSLWHRQSQCRPRWRTFAAGPQVSPRRLPAPRDMKLAIVGATGAVGRELLRILVEERGFSGEQLRLLASPRSAGTIILHGGAQLRVEELSDGAFDGVDVAFFAASGTVSRKFAAAAVHAGSVVIDNSSAFRLDPSVPLIVPEVNPQEVLNHNGIIANPNCSTIIMNLAVFPIHQHSAIRRIVASTYQAASGAGAAAVKELENQASHWAVTGSITIPASMHQIFGRQLLWNAFTHNSPVDPETLNCEEELKMIHESRKIMGCPSMGIACTCVRIPVLRSHCISVNLELEPDAPVLDADAARALLKRAPGVVVRDGHENHDFPDALMASEQDEVFVGRIRADPSVANGRGLQLFIAGDQIRKGAALNAVQIMDLILHTQE